MARPYQLSLTVGRLRRGVTACCWLAGICLAIQAAVWSIAYFTQVRFEVSETRAHAAGGTRGAEQAPESGGERKAAARQAATTATAEAEPPAAPRRERSTVDRVMEWSIEASAPVGAVCLAMLVPLMGFALVISVVAQIPGSERAVSALFWALMLSAVGLPVARTLGVSSYGGLFMDYSSIVGPLDVAMGDDGFAHPGLVVMAKHLLLPSAAVLSLLLIGLLFRSGLEAGLLPQEMLTVDPVMDREVARVAASGPRLGGRTAAALGSAVVPAPTAPPEPGAGTSVVRTSAGDAPRRII